MISRHALETANSDRLFFNTAAATSGLTRPVTNTPQHARKHIAFPVHDISVRITLLGYEADIGRNRRMGGTGPLTINNFMEVIWIRSISRLHRTIISANLVNGGN